MYILQCCICYEKTDTPPIQWLNGRLLTMNQILEDYQSRFSSAEMSEHELADMAEQVLLPAIEFAVMAVAKAGNTPRTIRWAKRVIIQCSK